MKILNKKSRWILAVCVIGTLAGTPAFAAWQMFSDGKDTYIYNTESGDVYIRHRKDGKNYEDTFVKMPAGVIPAMPKASQNKAQSPAQSTQSPKDSQKDAGSSQETRLEAIRKSQELMRQSIDSSSLLE